MTLLAYVVASYMSMQLAGGAGSSNIESNAKPPEYYILHDRFTYNRGDNLYINVAPTNVPYHSDNAIVKFYSNGLYRHCTNLKELIDSTDYKTYQLTDSYINIDMHIIYNNTTICMYNLVMGSAIGNNNFWSTQQTNSFSLVIDLQKPCDAKLECKITESSKYVCTFNTQRPNTLYYTIRQMYSTTNITIGRIIDIYYAQTIVFTIKIERFDFNSAIVARLNHFKDENEDFLHDLKIAERDIVKDHNYAIMSYSDTERVIFSCVQDNNNYYFIRQYSSVGLIDSSGYKIETVEGTTYNELLDVSKNGSMLCCIYYKVSNLGETTDITRVIANKTLLLYKKDEMKVNETETEATRKGYLGLYVAIPTVLLAAAFVAVVYVCCKKKPLPNPTVPTSQPYYGNQIFPREPNRGIYILPENNDPEYEQVS